MGKPYPLELRQRVVAHVEAGNTQITYKIFRTFSD